MTPLRILIVEDDAIIGELLGEMLEMMGHQICSIESNESAALVATSRFVPDLLIVDVRLEAGDGVSLVRRIMLEQPTAHLFVSGDLRRVQAAMPAAAMLKKPYDETQLASGIKRAVDARFA